MGKAEYWESIHGRGYFNEKWSKKSADYLNDNGFKKITLDGSFGDLSFLSEFKDTLEEITVINHDCLTGGLSPLENLTSLVIGVKAKDELDFSAMKKLSFCQIHHNKKHDYSTLYSLQKLNNLIVLYFGNTDLKSFGKKINVETLYLNRPRIQRLEGISAAKKLVNLRITNAHYLEDITEIASLPCLENMLVQTAKKVKDCTPFGKVTSLKSLVLICTGGLEQTDWISSLVNLEKLAFTGFPAGVNWNQVMALPNLKEVFIMQTKEHAPNDEEIHEKALNAGKVIAKIERTGTKKIPWISVRFSPPIDP